MLAAVAVAFVCTYGIRDTTAFSISTTRKSSLFTTRSCSARSVAIINQLARMKRFRVMRVLRQYHVGVSKHGSILDVDFPPHFLHVLNKLSVIFKLVAYSLWSHEFCIRSSLSYYDVPMTCVPARTGNCLMDSRARVLWMKDMSLQLAQLGKKISKGRRSQKTLWRKSSSVSICGNH